MSMLVGGHGISLEENSNARKFTQQAVATANGLDEWPACLLTCKHYLSPRKTGLCARVRPPRAGVRAVDRGCNIALKHGRKDDVCNVLIFNDKSVF